MHNKNKARNNLKYYGGSHSHTHTHMCLHPKNTNTLFAYTFVLYLYMRDVVWRRWINITTYTRVDRYRKLKTRMRSVFGCGVRIWNWNIQHAATSSAELCDFIWIVFFLYYVSVDARPRQHLYGIIIHVVIVLRSLWWGTLRALQCTFVMVPLALVDAAAVNAMHEKRVIITMCTRIATGVYMDCI